MPNCLTVSCWHGSPPFVIDKALAQPSVLSKSKDVTPPWTTPGWPTQSVAERRHARDLAAVGLRPGAVVLEGVRLRA